MVQINMKMPDNCDECCMVDSEFIYCHAKNKKKHWDVWDEQDNWGGRPTWCPLIEVDDNDT